jgi:hypothetical protein
VRQFEPEMSFPFFKPFNRRGTLGLESFFEDIIMFMLGKAIIKMRGLNIETIVLADLRNIEIAVADWLLGMDENKRAEFTDLIKNLVEMVDTQYVSIGPLDEDR